MATYKVIQDIEAEDKFLGPLTLKQFIFGAVSAIFLYLCVIAVTKNAAWMMIVFLPPALLGAFLAIPWSKDQPTEVWVLAKLRFYFKPKRRIWDQSGVKELVTITVPKKIERQLTNNLSQSEVRSRLNALAETIDSRGWAVKHSSVTAAAVDMDFSGLSDRLISPSMLPKPVPDYDVSTVQDVMDVAGNPIAANFDQMMEANNATRRDQSLEKMERIRRGEPLESIHQTETHYAPPPRHQESNISPPKPPPGPIVPPQSLPTTLDERQLSDKLRAQSRVGDEAYGRMYTVPVSDSILPPIAQTEDRTHETKTDTSQTSSTMTTPANPVILNLAQNDDLSVETIARQAQKSDEQSDGSEVVISLR